MIIDALFNFLEIITFHNELNIFVLVLSKNKFI